MGDTVITAQDPRALIAAFSAQARTAPDRAKVAGELAAMLNAYNAGITDHQGLHNAMVDFDSTWTRETTGKGTLDPVNLTLDVLQGVKLLGDAVSTVEKVVDTDKLYSVGGSILSMHATTMDIVGSGPVQDLISDYRARTGADYTDEYTHTVAPAFEGNVGQAMQLANSDPEALRALQAQFPNMFVDPTQTSVTSGSCVTDHPEIFNQVTNTTIIVQRDDSVLISDIDAARSDVLQKVSEVGAQIQDSITDVQQNLGMISEQNAAIAQGVQGIAIFLQKQASSKAEQDRSEQARKEVEQTISTAWSAADATVTGAAGIAILLGDPKLASDIEKFGSGALGLAKCVVTFANAMSALTAGVKVLSALGAAAATGNLIGAVASLVTLLLPSEPTPEEQILTEIGHIEDALSDIEGEISSGFNQIDNELSTIYTTVMGSLSKISATVTVTLEEVLTIRQALVSQARQLGELSIEVSEWFKASERASFEQDITTALGWSAHNATPMTGTSFGEFSGHFAHWAIAAAYDEINQPLAGRPLDLGSLGTELAGSLYDNLSYLNRYLTATGKPGLTDAATASAGPAPLPNVQMWSLAAAAFAQLNAEWPGLALPGDNRFDEISAIGTDLRDRIHQLANSSALWPAVLGDYHAALAALAAALDALRVRFQNETLPQRLGLAGDPSITAAVDMSKPASQPFTWAVAMPQAQSPVPGHAALTAPDRMHETVPALYLLADFLNPASRQLSCVWNGSQSSHTVTRIDPVTHDPYDVMVWTIYASAEVRYAGVKVGGLTVAAATNRSAPESDVIGWVASNWTGVTNLLGRLNQETRTQNVGAPAATQQAATTAAEAGLLQAATWFVGTLPAALSAGGECADVADALQGSWYVIENLVRLLFPVPRVGDDALRALFGSSPVEGGIALPDVPVVASAMAKPVEDDAMKDGYPDIPTVLTELAQVPSALLLTRIGAWQDACAAGSFSNVLIDLEDPVLRLANTEHLVTWQSELETVVAAGEAATGAIQQALHTPATRWWDEPTQARSTLVRDAAYNGTMSDVKALQAAVGVVTDGVWGPVSKAALKATVKSIQGTLRVTVDGQWGPITDQHFAGFSGFVVKAAAAGL